MITLLEQLDAVRAKLNAERELGGQKDADKIAALEAQEADINSQIMEQAQQTRLQEQEDKVAGIELPYDYNDLFEHPDANDNIIAVVKQFQKQAYEEHNAEVTRINEAHRQETSDLKALNDLKQKLIDSDRTENERLNDLVEELKGANDRFVSNSIQDRLDLLDAGSKRDNAIQQLENTHAIVSENETLKAQIEALKQELMAKKAISVDTNDKLAELANKAKESTIAKANRGLARWGMDEIPTLAVHEIEPVSEVVEPVMEVPFSIQTTDSGTNTQAIGNEAIPETVGEVKTEEVEVFGPVTREEINALTARVEALEQKLA